jgi:hypothetical protein
MGDQVIQLEIESPRQEQIIQASAGFKELLC